ncbi:probable protein RER1 [Zygosaccharomyces bailii]|nr:probable protein RER1 [Zygosaccharomyces bailii]
MELEEGYKSQMETLSPVTVRYHKALTFYRYYLDKSVPLIKERWAALGLLLFLFELRVVLSHKWYLSCYAHGIFLLNQFLGFLTPKFDMSLQQDEENKELEAGERADEFKPFIRRLPEFKFWHISVKATLIALISTIFNFTDIPVFWPILLVYFITIFFLTMKRQIQHMIKYKYIPLDIGKKKYTSSK